MVCLVLEIPHMGDPNALQSGFKGQVGDFEVAISGGFWVAAGGFYHRISRSSRWQSFLCRHIDRSGLILTQSKWREIDGLSYEEISVVMECPVGTVRSRIFRAREAIDERIAQWIKRPINTKR